MSSLAFAFIHETRRVVIVRSCHDCATSHRRHSDGRRCFLICTSVDRLTHQARKEKFAGGAVRYHGCCDTRVWRPYRHSLAA